MELKSIVMAYKSREGSDSNEQGWQNKELNRLSSLKNNLTGDGNYFSKHLKCTKILLRE